MDISKHKLEELIKEKKTLGNYIFDNEKKCFISDTKIHLYISKIGINKYKSEFYYFDGYEIWLNEDEKELYVGDERKVKKKAVESFNSNPEIFMYYPILYTNILCNLYEN